MITLFMVHTGNPTPYEQFPNRYCLPYHKLIVSSRYLIDETTTLFQIIEHNFVE